MGKYISILVGTTQKMVNKPVKVIRIGGARASVFFNVCLKDGKELLLPKVAFEIRFKDSDGNWQGTSSMTVTELPKAILALQKAHEFLLSNKHAFRNQSSLFTDS